MNIGLITTRIGQAQALLAALSVIPELVQQAQDVATSLLPKGIEFPGTDKLEIVKAKVAAYLDAAGHEAAAISAAMPQIVAVINAWVATFKAVGLFKKAAGLTGSPSA